MKTRTTGGTTLTHGHTTPHTALAVHGTGAGIGARSGADILTVTPGMTHGTTVGTTLGSMDGMTLGITEATGADGMTRMTTGDTGAGVVLGTMVAITVTTVHIIHGTLIMQDGTEDGILTTVVRATDTEDTSRQRPHTVRDMKPKPTPAYSRIQAEPS